MAVNPNIEPHGVTDDPIVNEVIELIVKRHLQGMEKFGKTMSANERPINEWVDETIEELLDAIHYLVKTKTIFDKFKAEFKKFICEDGSYVEEKKALSAENPITKAILISAISGAIGATIGYTATLLAPAVTILLFTVGKMGKNAYCNNG